MSRKKKSRFLINLEYCLILTAIGILRALPLQIAYKLSSALAVIAYFLVFRIRSSVIRHILHAGVAKDLGEAKKIAFAHFIHLGKVVVEFVKVDQYVTPDNCKDYSVWNVTAETDRILKSEKGIVMVGCHFGNWEMSGLVYSVAYKPIVSIMRPLENEKINNYIKSRRSSFRQEICNREDAVKVAIRALKAGKTLGILSDQHAGSGDGGIETVFFGHPARTYPTASYLSLRLNCPLFLGYAKRLNDKFLFEYNVIGPLTVERTDNIDDDARRLTQKFTTVLEEEIRKDPAQWLWAHRRWLDIDRGRKNNKQK